MSAGHCCAQEPRGPSHVHTPADPDALALPLFVDDFPNMDDYATVYFPERLFGAPEFRTRDVGRLVVIDLR